MIDRQRAETRPMEQDDEIPEPMSIEEANAEVRAMVADRAED